MTGMMRTVEEFGLAVIVCALAFVAVVVVVLL
jgi:hypothetical protein